MRRRSFLAALAVTLALAAPARAGILVTTDSGNVGAFSFVNAGISSGTATILVGVPGITSQMNTVNGVVVTPEFAAVNTPLTLLVTHTTGDNYTLAISPNTAVKTIGAAVGAQAKLPFTLTTGTTPTILPDFFNASGTVTGVTANANPTYDFSPFAAGGGQINFTFTATSYTGTTNFAGLFATVGATAVGNGSFSQIAAPVPAPPGLALAITGMVSLVSSRVIRRWHASPR